MPSEDKPICLTVPGLDNSGPGHWQTLWEQQSDHIERVELGCWSDPDRELWIARLDAAVRQAERPVILIAHSLGCLAVAWWASRADPSVLAKVAGALLVAPPDADRPDAIVEVLRFAPAPRERFSFPSILVASADDPYAGLAALRSLADAWGSRLVDIGAQGHINTASGLGDWPEGRALLETHLVSGSSPSSSEAA